MAASFSNYRSRLEIIEERVQGGRRRRGVSPVGWPTVSLPGSQVAGSPGNVAAFRSAREVRSAWVGSIDPNAAAPAAETVSRPRP